MPTPPRRLTSVEQHDLVELQKFFAQPAACAPCGWQGTIGQLAVADVRRAPDGSETIAALHCPNCDRQMSEHYQDMFVNVRRRVH